MNKIGFNPRSDGFMYTVGNNGYLNLWDHVKKNKIAFFNLGIPISTGSLSNNGDFLALGLGYDWSLGLNGLN